jgi:hypothetical protein
VNVGCTPLEVTPAPETKTLTMEMLVGGPYGNAAMRTKSRLASLATLIRVSTRDGYAMPDKLPNAASTCSCVRERCSGGR